MATLRCLLVLFCLSLCCLFSVPPIFAETSINYFTLSPQNPYVDTGIDLLVGDVINIRREGTSPIYVPGASMPPGIGIGPMGDPNCIANTYYTLPGTNCWSFIAKIGDQEPFVAASPIVGEFKIIHVTRAGRLHLGINHAKPFTGSGFWRFQIITNYTPPPPPPEPFLDLPWDYKKEKERSFSEAVLAINSFFEHAYPLLSAPALNEPAEHSGNTLTYRGFETIPITVYYTSHDGYDYGRDAGAPYGSSVKAAADGCASYQASEAIGNAILINHHNHHQTRYYHLQPEGLVTKSTTSCVDVEQGQNIGLVGSTGNSTGPHLHFMIVEDKNRDGDFDDNIPDGITDPFGWQSYDPDPWPNFGFYYKGKERTGNDSHYLWIHQIENLNLELNPTPAEFLLNYYHLNFPANSTDEILQLNLTTGPQFSISDTLQAVTATLITAAQNLFGIPITQFFKPFQLTIDFSNLDLSRYQPQTLVIMSSPDGEIWVTEETVIDWLNQQATASIDHFSYFALVAELLDTTPPITTATATATPVTDNTFAEPVTITLSVEDPGDSLGIDFTLYQINDGDWQDYTEPIDFVDDGDYTLHYYSVDMEENIEAEKTYSFTVDSSLAVSPELIIDFNRDALNLDYTATPGGSITVNNLPHLQQQVTASTSAGSTATLNLAYWRWFFLQNYRFNSLQYNQDSPTPLNNISLSISIVKSRKGELKNLTQILTYPGQELIIVNYNVKKDKTFIIIKKPRQKPSSQTFAGPHLLQLFTEEGSLKYTY